MDPAGSFGNRKLASVVKKVLVLRIVASDIETNATEAELSNKIFGTSGDVLNLKSQYNRCSNGQIQFEPLTTNNIVGPDGVYTVNLPSAIVTNASDVAIRDAAVDKATRDLAGGTALKNVADHVMICIPSGTKDSSGDSKWLAYAYVNHWLSVFNDDWCKSPSAQMHEMGK
jgi:hypothetical protein